MPNITRYHALKKELDPQNVTLIAVSKTKPQADIQALYDEGQRIFGENRVAELAEKAQALPQDIQWHMIGHLQRNKVRELMPFVHCIHSVDSLRLFKEIAKEARKIDRKIDYLLQFKIAKESSKYGLTLEEAQTLLNTPQYLENTHVQCIGVMGMATFSDDETLVRSEFAQLRNIFEQLRNQYFANNPRFQTISMGMSGDYPWAIEEGATWVRIGSTLFGAR